MGTNIGDIFKFGLTFGLVQTATGGLQAGTALFENMAREAAEEADLDPALVKQCARFVFSKCSVTSS